VRPRGGTSPRRARAALERELLVVELMHFSLKLVDACAQTGVIRA